MKLKIFEYPLEVKQDDLDELNHVNNVRYFNFLQEAAIKHWQAAVPEDIQKSLRWVVKKHEIEYLKPAFLADHLIVKTWIETMEGVSSIRRYEIYKGPHCIVKAQTLWIALNPKTMKPQRVIAEWKETFFSGH
jgi:acyl-CoA thioester hydrolase